MVPLQIKGFFLDREKMPIAVLCDDAGGRVLPVWIGPSEANSIIVRLEKIKTPGPPRRDVPPPRLSARPPGNLRPQRRARLRGTHSLPSPAAPLRDGRAPQRRAGPGRAAPGAGLRQGGAAGFGQCLGPHGLPDRPCPGASLPARSPRSRFGGGIAGPAGDAAPTPFETADAVRIVEGARIDMRRRAVNNAYVL